MKKRYIVIIISTILVIVLFVFFYWNAINMLKPEAFILMERINVDEQSEVKILYIPGNATSQNITQVRKINHETKEEYVLGNYERYNYLDQYWLEGDSLVLVLRDTSVYHIISIDTVKLNTQDIKYKIE